MRYAAAMPPHIFGPADFGLRQNADPFPHSRSLLQHSLGVGFCRIIHMCRELQIRLV
jgi:hypothetical protein